jgi:hypothetical protein
LAKVAEMDPTRILLVSEPGLAERAVSGDLPHTMSEAVELVDAFVASPTVRGSALGAELASLLEPTRGLQEKPRGGFWDTIYRMFEPSWHVKVGEHRQTLDVGVYYLVPPPVGSAEVTLSAEASSGSSTATSIKVLGIGGGPTTTLMVSESFERSVESPEVFAITVPAVFEEIDVRLGPGRGTRYVRLARLVQSELGFLARPLSLPKAEGERDDHAVNGDDGLSVDLRGQGGRFKRGASLAKGMSWEGSAGLSLENAGLEASVTWVGTYDVKIGLEYDLPGGYHYRGQRSATLPTYIWSVRS